MTHLAGIAGPTRFSDLRHVRKTVTFDGQAGSGAVGTVDVFTITGRVILQYCTVFCTDALTDAGATADILLGVNSDIDALTADTTATGIDTGDWVQFAIGAGAVQLVTNLNQFNATPLVVSEDIIFTVQDEAITGGTLVIDAWYLPITDDGALVAA